MLPSDMWNCGSGSDLRRGFELTAWVSITLLACGMFGGWLILFPSTQLLGTSAILLVKLVSFH